MSTDVVPEVRQEDCEAFVGRLFEAAVGGWELVATHIGLRLGLYAALAESPAGLTTAALSEGTGVHPRYVQEWLEQQTTAGVLEVSDPAAEPEARVFRLPPAQATVLLDERSPFYVAPLADWTAVVPTVVPKLLEAYRSGGGVDWGEYGEIVLDGQAAFNRPLFEHTLAPTLEAQLPDIDARLKADGGRVCDVGCGYGWSTLALASAYPRASVLGVDVHEPSVERARSNAAEAGLTRDRVTFAAVDASREDMSGPNDLVTIFEALHDMPHPVEVLANIRRSLAPGGAVLVMDENVGDRFGERTGNPVERFMYVASTLCCLPAAMVDQPSAATGTVMRPSTMRRYAEEAGYSRTTELAVEDPFHKYYRLDA